MHYYLNGPVEQCGTCTYLSISEDMATDRFCLLQTGDLVKDWRRMNVSFTRARCKLVIFGSRSTLQPVQLLDDFFQLMEGNGWILQLPPGADVVHRGAFAAESNGSMDVGQDVPSQSVKNDTSQLASYKPFKRPADDADEEVELRSKENMSLGEIRAKKKLKTGGMGRSVAGILKGRPILQDLVNEEA